MSLRSVALAQFAYGSGTVDDPYRVANQTHLDNVRTELDKHFLQTANITLSGNWSPIGTLASQFSGVYDGGNFSITSLNVVDGGNDRGLFGRAMNGSIIRNVSVSGLVSGGVWAGGLLGRGEHTIISNCFANVAVSSQENNTLLRVGGLVGRLGGTTSHGRALVQDSYAWGSVAAGAQGKAGGLVGQLVGAADIRNSYSIGPVSGGVAGGLVGEQLIIGDGSLYGAPVISSSYWNTQTSGPTSVTGGIGRTTAQMQTLSTFSGWNFTDIWRIYETKSYPYLRAQAPTVQPLSFNPPGSAVADTNVAVTISSPTPDVTFHYIIDADRIEPGQSDPEAPTNGVVNVPVPGSIAAVGWKPYYNPSAVATAAYIGYTAEPVFDPPPGPTPGDSVTVTLNCATPDAMIRWTTNGVDPVVGSGPFFSSGSPLTITVPGEIRARAEKTGLANSSVVTGIYSVAASVDAPVFSPAGGGFSGTAVVVTVTCNPTNATIHYWLNDGATNQIASGDQVSVPLGSGEDVYLYAMAFKDGMNDSSVSTGVYWWAGQVAMPTFTPDVAPDGVTNVVVTIMSETEESIQYYTVDGSIPTTNSPSVSNGGTVNVPVPGTLRAMAAKDGLDQSELQFRYFGSFAGGTGVAGAPYLVAIPEQLDNVRYYPTNHIRLIADIDLGQGVWTNGMGWQPIGHLANPFTGSFDGNGHTIDGLFISRTNQVDIGLFGYLGAGSRIANLGLLGGSVAGKDYVGALVGYSLGTISNCFATCSVDGVIGAGAMELGGVGGLVGYSSGLVRNSYALGAITGNRNLGGLVGSNAGSIIHAYSAGPIDPVENAGGLLGVWISGSIEHCFWDKATSGLSVSGGGLGAGKITAEMQQQGTFSNWNFNQVWGIVESNSYPYLQVLADPVSTPVFNPDGGEFGVEMTTVTITSATTNAIIHYTTNGTQPTVSSPLVVNGSVVIPVPSTLKAIAIYPRMRDSEIKQAEYTALRVATPVFDPQGGSFTGVTFIVTITCETTDAIIRYTTNGSDPTTSSAIVPGNGQVDIPVDAVLKARAWKVGWLPSLVTETQYSPSGTVEAPQFSPEGGQFDGDSVLVTLTSATTNATIHYTTDGTDPTVGSLVVPVNGQVTIPLPRTLKAKAWKDGLNPSAIKTAYYGHFAGGDGTTQNPYLIALPGHLNKIRDYNNLGTVFRMIADIDLASSVYTNWLPVGNYSAPFLAVFDGNGHVIRNLTISRSSNDDIGLFGSVGASAVIRNLGILGGSVSGKNYVGGLVGWSQGSISNSFATCFVQGAGQVSGGLVGGNATATALIRNSYAKGNVSGNSQVGGLVGLNQGGIILYVYSTGLVIGNTDVGGLVGKSSGSVTASFWDEQSSGRSSSPGGGTGEITAEMKKQTTFDPPWDFSGVWAINEGQTYPYLQVLSVGGGDEQLRDWLYSYYSSVEDLPEFSVKGDPLLWEYIAGTDPTDPESLFAVSEAAGSASNLTLQVDSLTGRIYRLLSTPSLEALNWQPVGVAQEGTGGPLNLSAPAPTTRAFYRISVELAD